MRTKIQKTVLVDVITCDACGVGENGQTHDSFFENRVEAHTCHDCSVLLVKVLAGRCGAPLKDRLAAVLREASEPVA